MSSVRLIFLLLAASRVQSFTLQPSSQNRHGVLVFSPSVLCMSSKETESTTSEAPAMDKQKDVTDSLRFPTSFDEMVRQSASTMKDAAEQGITRQIIRVLLPRDANNEQLLQYYEADANVDLGDAVLVPPDETWQGGIMQLMRVASITAQEMIRNYLSRSSSDGGVPPRMQEDRSVDESGVDGITLWITQAANPKDDISCFVQPSQETVASIESISNQAGPRLVTLVNPQWRIADDALDSASKQNGVLGSFASFLGGKGASLRKLDDLGFQATFTLEGYVCRGGNVRLMKRFDSDWVVFAENDARTDFIKVGTLKERPTYQDIDQMLESKGISLKYARDIGLAPKL